MYGFFALFSFQKTSRHQLFQNTGTGGRGSQSFPLGILRHIIFPGSLHSRKQRILGEMLGWAGFALLDDCTGQGQTLAFGQLWQRFTLGFFIRLRDVFQIGTVGSIQRPPAEMLHRPAFGGKLNTGALHGDRSFGIGMGLGHGAQQTQSHQLQHRPFAHRQTGQVSVLDITGGDHCMMVGHSLVVDNRTGVAGNSDSFSEGHGISNQIHQHRQTLGHVRSQIAAVRAGIGAELLFIQVL